MPQSSICRLLLAGLFCYTILVILFVGLPSTPSVNEDNHSYYFGDILRAGKNLRTVYQNRPIYHSSLNTYNSQRQCFELDWRLVKDVKRLAILLLVGPSTIIDLTETVNMIVPSTSLKASNVIPVVVRAGDPGTGVSMPWFNDADDCLLDLDANHDPKTLEIRAIVPSSGVVQIWPESSHWHTKPWDPESMPQSGSGFKPFITISNIPTTGDTTNIAQIQISDVTWQVPTRTFATRHLIFIILKPISQTFDIVMHEFFYRIRQTRAVLFSLLEIVVQVVLVYSIIVLGCSLTDKRPPLAEWAREFVLTEWLFKLTRRNKRTSEQVIEKRSRASNDDDEAEEDYHVIHRATLGSTWEFLRSKSPLDDLLNTFGATCWMVQPLWRLRTHRRPAITQIQQTSPDHNQEEKIAKFEV